MSRLRMLIGDDSYVDHRTVEDSFLCMFSSMKKELGINDGKLVDERVIDGWYKTNFSPSPLFDGTDIRVVDNVESMISEGNTGEYHWIISDLEYGRDRPEGGLEVFRRVNGQAKSYRPHKVIFTSSDDKSKLERIDREHLVHFLVAPTIQGEGDKGEGDKAELLGKLIGRVYRPGESK